MSNSPYIESTWRKSDLAFEKTLRPQTLKEFIGQEMVIKRLEILVESARLRNDVLGHVLLSGPPGLGKTTLASILAHEMGKKLVFTSGPALEKAGDLAGILTSLAEGDFLFIDEIHRLPRHIEEYLYSAMEDFRIDIVLDSGANARSVSLPLAKFCLIGATTKMGLISSPLRSRFQLVTRLDYYTPAVLCQVAERTAHLLGVCIDTSAAIMVANRSRGAPRIVNNLIRWLRDFSMTRGIKKLDSSHASEALDLLLIDEKGLDEMDKKILTTIITQHDGGPVGLGAIAASLGEDTVTLEEVHEQYLIMQGFLQRTQRGRVATEKAYNHLGIRD